MKREKTVETRYELNIPNHDGNETVITDHKQISNLFH